MPQQPAAAPISKRAGAAGVIALSTTSAQMEAWGWRIPFLLCLPLTLITLWVRVGLEDSSDFKDTVEKSEIIKAPFLSALPANPCRQGAVTLLNAAN